MSIFNKKLHTAMVAVRDWLFQGLPDDNPYGFSCMHPLCVNLGIASDSFGINYSFREQLVQLFDREYDDKHYPFGGKSLYKTEWKLGSLYANRQRLAFIEKWGRRLPFDFENTGGILSSLSEDKLPRDSVFVLTDKELLKVTDADLLYVIEEKGCHFKNPNPVGTDSPIDKWLKDNKTSFVMWRTLSEGAEPACIFDLCWRKDKHGVLVENNVSVVGDFVRNAPLLRTMSPWLVN